MTKTHLPVDFSAQYGPWALVAGASYGLGAAFARHLASLGLNLVLVARSADALDILADQIRSQFNRQVRTLVQDLAVVNAVGQITTRVSDLEIGLLVSNAAVSCVGLFLETSLEDHFREIQVNVSTPLALAHLFGQKMVERGKGGIILMSSLSSTQGSPMVSNYAATKAYLRILGEGLWDEFRPAGVDVISCWASSIDTPGFKSSIREGKTNGPVRPLTPEQVARETIDNLGRSPWIIPGRTNRAAAFLMQRILPRRMAVEMMGRVMRKMYQ
jgi:uncharacterized protein